MRYEWQAYYLDGHTAIRHPATVRLMRLGLEVETPGGWRRFWPYGDLRQTQGFYEGEDVQFSRSLFQAGYRLKFIPLAIVMHDDDSYTQKGYGVVRRHSWERTIDPDEEKLRIDKLCPRTIS